MIKVFLWIRIKLILVLLFLSLLMKLWRGYPIDMFLYANNYEAEGDLIRFFSKKRRLFRYSRREEKQRNHIGNRNCGFFCKSVRTGTNSRKTDILIENFFDMFKKGVKVGQIRTKLRLRRRTFGTESSCNRFIWNV